MLTLRRALFAVMLLLAMTVLFVPPLSAAPAQQEAPPGTPQPLNGKAGFAQNCAPCHGAAGKGDGPSASGLTVPPSALGQLDKVAGKSLQELFNVTKNGNMARMMPPWKGRLTDPQIWDIVGYTWSLHTSPAELAAGKAVYDKECAACHGPDGKGKPPALDLTDFAKTSALSQATWADVLATGRGTMPGFGGKLSADDQRAVLEYARSLSLGPMVSGPVKGTGTITGTIVNGTTGQPVPNTAVELGIFDETALLNTVKTTTDATGAFRFTDLPTAANVLYIARGWLGSETNVYSTAPAQFAAGQSTLSLPLKVYETTTDGSGVTADRVHFIIEIAGGQIFVTEVLVFSLSGNKAFTGDGTGVLRFGLPAGAENLEINDGELGGRYAPIPGGFADLLPLSPGTASRQIMYRYDIPYLQEAVDLTRAIPYPAANVNALIADVGAQVTSDQLQNMGARATQGGNFISLAGQNLLANQPITLKLRGLPVGGPDDASAASAPPPATNDKAILLILIGGIGLLAALMVALPLMRRPSPQAAGHSTAATAEGALGQDDLIDALARLDIAYRAGEMAESTYREQRMRLKAQLLDVARASARTTT